MKPLLRIALLLTTLILPIAGCGQTAQEIKTVQVTMVYGSEKREWLEPLVQAYNLEGRQTAEGSTIVIEATMGHRNSFTLKKAEVEAGQ